MFGEVDGMVQAFENGRMSRRELVAGLGTMFATWAGLTRPAFAKEDAVGSNSTFEAVGLNHIALRVTDIPRSREFYKKHLGMTVRRESERNCFMNCGRHWIAMFRGDEPRMDHYCYSIRKYEAGDAVDRANKAGLKPHREANRVYFPDPDGLTVQVASLDH